MNLSELSWRKLYSVAGTFIAAFGTFGFFAIQGILLARLLGPEGRGAFATIVGYPQMLLYLGLLGAAEIFARLGAQVRPGESDAPIRRSALIYGLFTGSITGVACVLLAWFALPQDKQYLAPLAIVASLTIPFQHMRLAVQGVDHGRGSFNRYNVIRVSASAIFPVILIVLWISGISSLLVATWGFFFACFAGVLLCQWGMHESWFGKPKQPLSLSLKTGKGLAVSQIAAEILDRADLILILWLGTLAEQGLYTSAIPMAATMIIVPNAIGLYSFRRGSGESTPLTATGVTKLVALVVLCQLVFGAILAAVIPIAIPLLYGELFQETVRYAWLLLPAGAVRGLLMATDTYLRGRGKPIPGIVGRIVGIVVLLILTVTLYESHGIIIIPIAVGVAQMVCVLIVIEAMYRDARGNRPSESDPQPQPEPQQ